MMKRVLCAVLALLMLAGMVSAFAVVSKLDTTISWKSDGAYVTINNPNPNKTYIYLILNLADFGISDISLVEDGMNEAYTDERLTLVDESYLECPANYQVGPLKKDDVIQIFEVSGEKEEYDGAWMDPTKFMWYYCSGIPATGDTAHPYIWAALIAVALAGIVFTARRKSGSKAD